MAHNQFPNFWNIFPWSGFLIKSEIIYAVWQYPTFKPPFSILSIINKQWMLIAWVFLLEIFFPFSSNNIVLLLS